MPAFETFQYKFDFPESKSQLLSQLDTGKLEIFRASVWPQGHGPTDYEKWKKSTENYKVNTAINFCEIHSLNRQVHPCKIKFSKRFCNSLPLVYLFIYFFASLAKQINFQFSLTCV